MNLDQHPYLDTYLQALRQAEQNFLMLIGIVAAIVSIYLIGVKLRRQREIVLALTGFFWLTFLLAILKGV